MVAVDVVIIQTVENNSTSMGVNLLHGLELQFGNTQTGTPAFNDAFSNYLDYQDPSQNLSTRTITRAIGIPAIKYSLNIANSQAGKSEVLAQPTLVARPGQTSKFFSGVDINAAATSGGAGDSVSIHKLVGIHLTVTPEIAPNNVVLLNVQAERTFLTQPSSSVVFTFRMDTTKTTVDANVAMKFGQTLILSGLSEREIDKNRDGVPLLQDIPIVQYAFSQKTTASYNKSVLILLTPHRIQDGVPNDAGMTTYPTAASAQVQRLKRIHPSWFPAQSTYKTILKNLRGNTLFQEFRTGDMPDLVTASASERIKRLKEIANFLYY
jgi:type II secretory pathway component GspD/PulD (secretin)